MFRYRLTAFAVGAAIMMAEMAAARAIAPHFGASIIVWTNVIGIVMLALALGYWAGGRIAAAHPHVRVLGGIIIGAGILLLVPAFATRAIAGSLVLDALSFSGGFTALALGSFLSVTLLFAVPIALLGTVAPFLIQLAASGQDAVGRVAGSLYALSTVGSLVGTFLPALVLLPTIGTRRTIIVASVVLILVGAMLLPHARRGTSVAVLLAAALLGVPDAPLPWFFGGEVIAATESRYQYLRIVDRPSPREAGTRERMLIFNEGFGVQSIAVEEGSIPRGYFTALAAMPSLFSDGRALRVLILGNAGGTIGHLLELSFPDREIAITGVEIDPAVTTLTRAHFPPPPVAYPVVHADSRVFLQTTDAQYDIIVGDAYTDQLTIPAHLVSEEFFALVARHLAEDGIAAFNINAPRDDSRLLASLTQTIRSAFPHVMIGSTPRSWNRIVLASNRVIDARASDALASGIHFAVVERDPFRRPFTDDWAPIELATDIEVLGAMLRP